MTAETMDDFDEADRLLQQLAETEEEWSDGASKFGPFGLFDNLRKATLSAKAIEIRDSKTGEKVTETFIGHASHADKEYRTYLDDALVARAQWLALDAKRSRWMLTLKMIEARGYTRRRMGA